MPGILSFPSELLHEIIETCPERERCCLRATCKVLKEHADPIVFRRLRLYLDKESPRITERQIFALATRSSKACEFTRELKIDKTLENLNASRPHLGRCDDLRVHLSTAISTLKNMTHFSWKISDRDPEWLINSLMQAVACLPHLTELTVDHESKTRIPLGLFSNLLKLSVKYSLDNIFFVPEIATAIANSPHLKSLDVLNHGPRLYGVPLPKLSELLAKVPTKNPLCLEHLSIELLDATLDQATLLHLTQLDSFRFRCRSHPSASSFGTSFLVNKVKLSNVELTGIIMEETISYLSSLSGLKRLAVSPLVSLDSLKTTLFTVILPKHVNSLRTLEICSGQLICDHASLRSITKCLKLRRLFIYLDSSIHVQLLLDTVSQLPELKTLGIPINERFAELANFIPSQGLRYVESLRVGPIWYVLERDGRRPVRYREI